METCYQAMRKEVLDGIELEEDRFGFEPELTAQVAAGGWRIYEVGISYTAAPTPRARRSASATGCTP